MLSAENLPPSITPEAIEIIKKLPAIHFDPVMWMSPLDEPIVLPYEVARIVQASTTSSSSIHAVLTSKLLGLSSRAC